MYWDASYTFDNDIAVKTTPREVIHPREARSAYGWTDIASPRHAKTNEELAVHQSSIPRLPIPELSTTCELYLDSLIGVCTAEEYCQARSSVERFLLPGGEGEKLQSLLKARENEMVTQRTSPSWLEPWWDDMYLCGRDPLPINVNYFFGLESWPGCSNQAWRAASLLHAAMTICLDIRNGTFPLEFERAPGGGGVKSALDMSQVARVFGASRVPAEPRDYIVTYTTRPPPTADRSSHTSCYVALDPSHVIVICRNRYFALNVINDESVVPCQQLYGALAQILTLCERPGSKGGPPVGVFTTQHRSAWAENRADLIASHPMNEETLELIQSALLVVVLDSVKEVDTLDELARVILHGSGTNRWFDKHQLIITRDASAGIVFEHAVGDGATTLPIVDEMYKRHKALVKPEEGQDNASMPTFPASALREIDWKLTGSLDIAMRDAFEDYAKLIASTDTCTLNFRQYGGNYMKTSKMSPDAYVQVAFQLSYFKMYGRIDATYESASTRSFLHGRTETVRSASSLVADLCHAVTTQPLFPHHARSTLPRPAMLLRAATDAHVTYMKKAKSGQGVDRHMLGLRMICLESGMQLPTLFTDAAFSKSSRWRLSTSHCGSTNLQLFGFGPVVPDGYGLGYMIKNDSISVCVTSNSAHPQGSSALFVRMLEATLLQMSAIVDSETILTTRFATKLSPSPGRNTNFTSPTASMCEFDFEPGVGFRYLRDRQGQSLYRARGSSKIGTAKESLEATDKEAFKKTEEEKEMKQRAAEAAAAKNAKEEEEAKDRIILSVSSPPKDPITETVTKPKAPAVARNIERPTIEESELRSLFQTYDSTSPGRIDREEFKCEYRKSMESYGVALSEKETDTLFGRYDKSKDGSLDFEEFAILMLHRAKI